MHDDIRNLRGPSVFTSDVSATAGNLGSVLQRGAYTLGTGKVFVALPYPYISSTTTQNIAFFAGSAGASHHYIESVGKVATLGTLSSVSGFTVSGSGSEAGYWLTVGYK